MRSFLANFHARNCSIVWLTASASAVLLASACAIVPGMLRRVHDGNRESASTRSSHRVIRDRTCYALGTRSGPSIEQIGAGPRFKNGRRAHEAIAVGVHPAPASGQTGSFSNKNTNDPNDAALFAALDRLERRMAASIATAPRIGCGS